MKNRRVGLIVIVACCALAFACVSGTYQRAYSPPPPPAPAPPPGAQDEPFYADLAPYGDWVYVSGPGWVWQPYNMPADWQPYQAGHWVLTDYGWTWASDEEFGWAVYHYGRWTNDGAYGWVWVPGTEWGPAWVAWHEGGGYVGWAPLPWQVTFQAGIGLDWGGVNVNVALGPSAWHFVPARAMVDPGCRHYIVPAAQNVTLIQRTSNVTNYTYIDNRVINQSVRVDTIGRAVGHPVPKYHVEQADSPEHGRGGGVQGDSFVVFRPDPERVMHSQRRDVPPGHDGTRPAPGHHGPDNPWGVPHGQSRATRGMTQEPAPPEPPAVAPGGSRGAQGQQGSPGSQGQDGSQGNGPNQGQPPQSNRDAGRGSHGQRSTDWMQHPNQPPAPANGASGNGSPANVPAAPGHPQPGPGNSSNAPGHSSHDGRGNSSQGNAAPGNAASGNAAPGNAAPGNPAPPSSTSRPAPTGPSGVNGQGHDKTPPGKSQGKGPKPKPVQPSDASDKDKPKQDSQ